MPAILIIAAIAISIAKNIKKVNEQTPQQQAPSDFPTWKEVFPTLFEVETEEARPVAESFAEVNNSERPGNAIPETARRRERRPARQPQPTVNTAMTETQPADKEKPKREKLITMNTKSEAKRAFIYSEILTRKY